MDDAGNDAPEPEATVAVAVSGVHCRRAVRWAAENLFPQARRAVLLHVISSVSFIPSPSGQRVPIEKVSREVGEMYIADMKSKSQTVFFPFKKLCGARKVETLVLEGESPAATLLRYLSESGANNLVLGASSSNWFMRLLKGPDVARTVLRSAPNTCNIFVVSRRKLTVKLANQTVTDGPSPSTCSQVQTIRHKVLNQTEISRIFERRISVYSSISVESKGDERPEMSAQTDFSITDSRPSKIGDALTNVSSNSQITFLSPSNQEEQPGQIIHHNLNTLEAQTCKTRDILASFDEISFALLHSTKQSEDPSEVDRLRLELQNTLAMYNCACKDLIHARKKVQLLSAECSEEARKVKDAMEREEVLKQIAEEEKSKHLEAIKELEEAKQRLAKEALDRHKAEIEAIKESSEKLKIVDALLSNDKRYRRYSRNEIEAATDNFSDANKIGEGGYGVVYKCNLDHTPVAVKVLRPDAYEKKQEFLREVEVLSQLRHPNMVLLLGACPENGCLVYEYMENGSLEDRLFCIEGTQPLPWFIRFRIIFEVACGLVFLHGSKPEPIVHRDLKPGNILLDRNYVSKIGDVGLARLMSNVVPDGVTEYRDTVLAGTLHYMDPEYHRTGTLRPKSDLYAFGIIALQLLTARHPLGILGTVEKSLKSGSFADVLDHSVPDWPLVESEKLALIALKCSKLRCRDRPDLESEVIPELKELSNMANACFKLRQHNVYAPSHYFCPILQEVMDNPYIAADGFTYEYRAIKAWLEKHKISPVTKLKLQHSSIIPNLSLRSAIQEWKSHAAGLTS